MSDYEHVYTSDDDECDCVECNSDPPDSLNDAPQCSYKYCARRTHAVCSKCDTPTCPGHDNVCHECQQHYCKDCVIDSTSCQRCHLEVYFCCAKYTGPLDFCYCSYCFEMAMTKARRIKWHKLFDAVPYPLCHYKFKSVNEAIAEIEILAEYDAKNGQLERFLHSARGVKTLYECRLLAMEFFGDEVKSLLGPETIADISSHFTSQQWPDVFQCSDEWHSIK